MKSIAKVAKSGAERAGGGTRSGPTSGAASPPGEFCEHSTASAGQGDTTPAHFSNFIHKPCQSRGKLRHPRSRPLFPFRHRLQLGGGGWGRQLFGRSRGISGPFSSPRSPPVPERSAPLARAGGGRFQIGRPEGKNLRRRGSPHTGAGPRGQSSERGRTHNKQRNDRAPRLCAFAPADHPPSPQRL